MVRKLLPILAACLLLILLLIVTRRFWTGNYLNFSDGAKFADVARNIASGNGYSSNFSNFTSKALGFENLVSVSRWTKPVMPLVIAGFLKIFGVSDSSVIATSSLFYLLLVLTTYFLGKKLWGKLVGLLGAISVAFNFNFLEYALSGASETLFAFEIVLGAFLFALKKRWANILGFLVLVLIYFTRAQGIIYIFGLTLLFFLLHFQPKKALGYFLAFFVVGSFLYLFVSKQGLFAITQHLPGQAASNALRGAVQETNMIALFKKVFYNLYNFYKLLPQIVSPYMWAIFIIGLFVWSKNKIENYLKLSTIFMVVVTFLVTALTIPFFRYLHPVIPLIYLFATASLVWVVKKIFSKSKTMAIVSSLLIFIFVVGQSLGVIFLDSRFKAKTINKGKPPVYVALSRILKENTNPDDIIVTNLDTWGSWYGERKTIWYPLEPKQLEGLDDEVDAIYLTSYLIDDENYYMGPEWRQVFFNPDKIEGSFILENYILAGEFEISPEETYERQGARAILLVRNQ